MYTKNDIVTNTILYFSRRFTISSISSSLQNNSTASDAGGCAGRGHRVPSRGPSVLPRGRFGARACVRVCVFKSAKPGKEQTDKLKTTSGLVRGRVNTSWRRWPMVVNIGNSHTPGLKDPRMAHGRFRQRADGAWG